MKLRKKESNSSPEKVEVPITIEFECPLCDQELVAEPVLECQEVYCPTCRQVIVVPKANISEEQMAAAMKADSTLVLKAGSRSGLKLR